MSILFLTTILPRKKRMGSEVASQCFIDALTQNGYKVSVVGYMRKDDVFELNPQEILIDKRYIETKKAKLNSIIWLILSFLRGMPYSSGKYYSSTYIKTVKQLLSTNRYDAIIIDHAQLGWLQKFIPDKDKLIFVAHNIENQIYIDCYQNARNWISKLIYKREANLIKTMEDKLASAVQQVWSLTEHDAKYFFKIEGVKKIKVLPLSPGLEQSQSKPVTKQFDIGLIGSWFWKPNEEGLRWFLENVYPHLDSQLSIHIAGRGADWIADKYHNIKYRGIVPDAQEFMAQARVVAIPTLSGGGIQIKTLDAIASGSFIVATGVAIRGIYQPPSTVKISDNPEQFAKLLSSAVASPFRQRNFDEAKNWYRFRQENFMDDIYRAIEELSLVNNLIIKKK
jgi:polysaccharide biosynthesis protein PslH